MMDLNQFKEYPRQIVTIKRQLEIMDHVREALQGPGRETVAKLALLASLDKEIQEIEASAHQVISQVGSGTLILRDPNTYTGGTVIDEGELMNGSSSGSGTGTGPVGVNAPCPWPT